MKNHSENYSTNYSENPQANPQADYSTKHYLEKFMYNYSSAILGEYSITYQIYQSTYQNYPTVYTIKITNSLTDEECYLEEYSAYNEAVEDIERVNKLIKNHINGITYNIF